MIALIMCIYILCSVGNDVTITIDIIPCGIAVFDTGLYNVTKTPIKRKGSLIQNFDPGCKIVDTIALNPFVLIKCKCHFTLKEGNYQHKTLNAL